MVDLLNARMGRWGIARRHHHQCPKHIDANTLGRTGGIDVKLDVRGLADGANAGFAFMSGEVFDWVGVVQTNGVRRIASTAGEGLVPAGSEVWFRGVYDHDAAQLLYSLDGKTFSDTGAAVRLKFGKWKGARMAIFCFGSKGGNADAGFVQYNLKD